MTKIDRVLEAFENGENLTAKQIQARFQVGNPSALIHQLRSEGFAIYANKSTNSKGESRIKYRLGKPVRKVVAAGYAALSSMGYQPFN
jgi:hypothetical protein